MKKPLKQFLPDPFLYNMSNKMTAPKQHEEYYTEEERMLITMPLSVVLQLISMRAELMPVFETVEAEDSDCKTIPAR